MSLHLGRSEGLTITSYGETLCVHIPSSVSPTTGILLKSSDNYILKDVNGLFLTAKEDDNG